MLQQILKDMYIDPDVLEALNEEQKKILFLKMRQEQVRRWKEREEKLEREGSTALKPKPEKAHRKSVSWLLGRDGDVHVCMIGEVDEFRSSKFIFSELRQVKGSNLQSNTRHQTDAVRNSLVNRGGSEPEDLPSQTPPGIQLHFKGIQPTSDSVRQPPPSQENSEELKSGSHLPPLQVSTPEPLSSTVEQEEDCNTSTTIDSLRELGLYYRLHGNCRSGSITDRLCPVDTQHAAPLTGADKLHPQEPKAQEQSKVGKDFQPVPTTQRAETEGSGPKGAGCTGDRDPTMARGRVAQLMKTFSMPSPKQDTLSRPKPPIPAKPSHLQLLASPTNR